MRKFFISKIFVFSLTLSLVLILSLPVLSQGNVFRKRTARGGVTPIYVEGYVLYHTANNTLTSYIVVKRSSRNGIFAVNAAVTIDGYSLRSDRSGAFTGTVKASNSRGRIGAMGVMGRRNNINIRIRTGGGGIVTVSQNINRGATMKIVPVYRIGVDVGEPVTVFCTKPRGNRNIPELIVLNAVNGNLILKRMIRGDRYVIPPKKLPPRRTLLFRVRLLEGPLKLNGNFTRRSYINLYSGGEFRVNSRR